MGKGVILSVMKHIVLILGLVFTPAPLFAERIPLANLSQYLNGIRAVQSTFTQINADGTVSTGDIYLNRPGRVRFEYDDEQLLVIAGGGQLAIFDGRSNTRPEQYPLAETPLNLILARTVDLQQSGMVTRHTFDGTSTRVVAQDPDRPEIGTIELVFTDEPVELRQWVITDEGGNETTLALGVLDADVTLRSRLFNIPFEIRDREGE